MPAKTIFFVYVFAFFLLRIAVSPNFSADEAEQFLNAQSFSWGYSSQAPLFSWLCFVLLKLGFEAVIAINFVKYLAYFFLLCFCFDFAATKVSKEKAFWLTSTLLYFPVYAHEFHRDLTHSVLVTCFAALSLKIFYELEAKPTWSNYLFLALSLSCGILSKYNFVFLITAMFACSLFFQAKRSLVLNTKAVFAAFSSCVLLIPHMLWLWQNDFSSLHHVINKTLSLDFSLLRILLEFLPSLLIVLILLIVLFRDYFKNKLDFFTLFFSFSALFLPLIVTLLKQASYFNYRWMAPLYLLLFFALLQNLALEKLKISRLLKISILAIVFVTFSLRLVFNFAPNLTSKHLALHMPIAKLLDYLQKEDLSKIVLLSDNRLLLANLKKALPELEIFWLEELSDDYFIKSRKVFKQEFGSIKAKIEKKTRGKKILVPKLVSSGDKALKKKYFKIFADSKQLTSFNDKYLWSEDSQGFLVYELAFR